MSDARASGGDRSRLLLGGLGALVVAVLLHGGAVRRDLRPQGPKRSTQVDVDPAPLRAELDKTPLAYFSDYWLQLGRQAKTKLALVGPRRTPALVVAPGLAVSTIESADGDAAPVSGATESPRLAAADAFEGLALYELRPPLPDAVFQPSDPASLHTGMLVAAVTVDADDRAQVTPGYLISAGDASPPGAASAQDSFEVVVPLGSSTRAAAIVDLDGNLVGAAFRSQDRTRLVPTQSLLSTVERLRARSSCGALLVADLHDSVRTLLNLEGGVQVERVERGVFRPELLLRAGDVLLEWDGHRVSTAAQFDTLYDAARPGAAVPYVLRRGRRSVRGETLMPGPDCRPLPEPFVTLPNAGLTLAPASSAWDVAHVVPGSPADGPGLQPGDRILAADDSGSGRDPILDGIRAFEERGRSVVLRVQRGDRVTLVALVPKGR